ncbi:MAG TPA: alanine racemase [Trichormus sp.]|jgi:alanine racemase
MVTSRQQTVSSTRRDAWVEVDLGAIEHNVRVIQSWLQPAAGRPLPEPAKASQMRAPRLMAVVKSDAYGHGAAGVAEVLIAAGAEWFAVASVDEGCQLRGIDSKIPILLLSPVPAWAIPTALEFGLDLTVTNAAQVHEIAVVAARKHAQARIHLKVDTGMHRLGIAPQYVDVVLNEIKKSDHLHLISVFSHLACADDRDAVTYQNAQFSEIVQRIRQIEPELRQRHGGEIDEPILFHLASGDAARRFPDTHYDMVRTGLVLYGLESRISSDIVIPAMSVRGRINHVSEIAEGESVGYNWTWTARRRTRLASIPIGYADGVDRRLSNNLFGLVMGEQIPQVGTISMDQMLFDITDAPEAQEGDVVTLIGTDGERNIQLSTWANLLDTITYELACRMRVRLPRIYTRHRHQSSGINSSKTSGNHKVI